MRSLEQRGIPATYLASTLPAEERQARFANIRRGKYRLVYVAPERLDAFFVSETKKWRDTALSIGIKPE